MQSLYDDDTLSIIQSDLNISSNPLTIA